MAASQFDRDVKGKKKRAVGSVEVNGLQAIGGEFCSRWCNMGEMHYMNEPVGAWQHWYSTRG